MAGEWIKPGTRSKDLTNNKIWVGDASNRPAEEAKPTGPNCKSGSYTGDGTDDRAIAHGLGVIPMLVIISQPGSCVFANVCDTRIENVYDGIGAAVTGWDATNFYVEQTNTSQNQTGVSYNFVAFK